MYLVSLLGKEERGGGGGGREGGFEMKCLQSALGPDVVCCPAGRVRRSQVTGRGSQVTSCRSRATGHRSRVAGSPVASRRSQVAGYST